MFAQEKPSESRIISNIFDLKMTNVETWIGWEGLPRLMIKDDARMARTVNKLLSYYPKDTRFTDEDQVIFKCRPYQVREALVSLGYSV